MSPLLLVGKSVAFGGEELIPRHVHYKRLSLKS